MNEKRIDQTEEFIGQEKIKLIPAFKGNDQKEKISSILQEESISNIHLFEKDSKNLADMRKGKQEERKSFVMVQQRQLNGDSFISLEDTDFENASRRTTFRRDIPNLFIGSVSREAFKSEISNRSITRNDIERARVAFDHFENLFRNMSQRLMEEQKYSSKPLPTSKKIIRNLETVKITSEKYEFNENGIKVPPM
jgi:hypothetical protein